jgi:hypothetical protein
LELARVEQSDQVSENSDITLRTSGNSLQLAYISQSDWSVGIGKLDLDGQLSLDERRHLNGASFREQVYLDYQWQQWLFSGAYSRAGDDIQFRTPISVQAQRLESDLWQFSAMRYWQWNNWSFDITADLGRITQNTKQASALVTDQGLQASFFETDASGVSGAISLSLGYALEMEQWLVEPSFTISNSRIISGDEEVANLLLQRNSDRLNLTRFVDAEQISREFKAENSMSLLISISHIDNFGLSLGYDQTLHSDFSSDAWTLSLWAGF